MEFRDSFLPMLFFAADIDPAVRNRLRDLGFVFASDNMRAVVYQTVLMARSNLNILLTAKPILVKSFWLTSPGHKVFRIRSVSRAERWISTASWVASPPTAPLAEMTPSPAAPASSVEAIIRNSIRKVLDHTEQ
jgi:hypothetical protein